MASETDITLRVIALVCLVMIIFFCVLSVLCLSSFCGLYYIQGLKSFTMKLEDDLVKSCLCFCCCRCLR